jgi:hypothetical protein
VLTTIRDRFRGQSLGIAIGMLALFVAIGGAGYAATSATDNGAGAQFARIDHVLAGNTACGKVTGVSEAGTCGSPAEMIPPATAVKARDLNVSMGGAVPDVVVTLEVNGVDTALTCTTNASGKCENTVDKVKISPGSTVSFKVASPTLVSAYIGWRAIGSG